MNSELWLDLAQSFHILFLPFIWWVLAPLFLGTGLVLCALMITARYWRPREEVDAIINHE